MFIYCYCLWQCALYPYLICVLKDANVACILFVRISDADVIKTTLSPFKFVSSYFTSSK